MALLLAGLGLAGCSSLARQSRDALGLGPKNETVHRDIVYAHRGGKDLKLDLYIPNIAHPAPVAVWFHGGAWKYGTKDFNFHLRDLTQQGFAVATVQYRKVGQAPWPAALEDCETGFAWLRQNAARYGLNPDQMFLTGESAGGHLAALLAAKLGRSQIRAVCLLSAPTDLEALWKKYEGVNVTNSLFVEIFGQHQTRARAREASPVERARRTMPPVLMYHGDHDWIVPVAQSRALDHRLKELGVESRLVVISGQNHAFPLTAAQLAEVADFFRQRL